MESRAARSFERFVAPALRAEQVLTQVCVEHDSVMLRSSVGLWRNAPVVYRLDSFMLDALAGTDLKSSPPSEVLGLLPHDVFVVAFNEPVELWDDEDRLSRSFEGVLVTGLSSAPDMSRFQAVPLSGPVGAVRGTFYGSMKLSGRSQIVTVTLPAAGFGADVAVPLERFLDDALFDEADVFRFDESQNEVAMSVASLRAEGLFAQGSLRRPLGVLLLQLLLYLSSREPDVCEQPAPCEPPPQLSGRAAAGVRMFELGWRVGSAFRESSRSGSGSSGSGLSTRPHLRRGHWHTYLYGGRGEVKVRRLKWVHPVVVNDGLGPVAGTVVAVGDCGVGSQRVGVRYVAADEHVSPEFSGEYRVSPDLRGRGARAHARLQNMVAVALRVRGRVPLSPGVNDPQFDVAWREGSGLVVVEVKSLADVTEVHQLRLGVGQVVEYRWGLASAGLVPVRAMLFVEREPSDGSWVSLCRDEQIVLAWPDTLTEALDVLFK